MGYVSTGMGNCLSSGPAMECVRVGIFLCHQTFINSSALLVSLMAVQLKHIDQKTFISLVFCRQTFMNCVLAS